MVRNFETISDFGRKVEPQVEVKAAFPLKKIFRGKGKFPVCACAVKKCRPTFLYSTCAYWNFFLSAEIFLSGNAALNDLTDFQFYSNIYEHNCSKAAFPRKKIFRGKEKFPVSSSAVKKCR